VEEAVPADDAEASADRPTDEAEPAMSERAPLLALAGLIVGFVVLYTALAWTVDVPRVHPDEVRYLIAASSLAEGEGLGLRGEEYGFGPLYAGVLALIIWLTPDLVVAYDWFKAANALFFALTAVPVYLLARRVVRPWWALLAAGLSVAIPSSISVATVMTESLSYLTSALALLAIALAIEQTTVARQLAVLGAVGLAFATRPQFAALYLSWLVALGLLWMLMPTRRPRSRSDLIALWPSVLPVALGVVAFGARVLAGSSPSESLGAYWELWRGYDPLAVAKWFVYHLADFTVYLAVVPVAVTPIVLSVYFRRARAGAEREAGFFTLFAAANVIGLLVVAAFTSTPWGYDRLHDRYAFYLLPLWLIVFVVWLAEGLPRPLIATATGVAIALALPVILPFRQLANEAGIDTVPGALWVWIESQTAGPGPLSGTRLLLLFVVCLAATLLFVPRRFAFVFPAIVFGVLAVTATFAWERIIDAPEDAVFAGGLERAWIDDRLGDDSSVTKLYLESDACPSSAITRHALFLTEFFNATVDRAAYIGDSVPDGIPLPRVDVAADGTLQLASGEPLVADYVFTQPGIELDGRPLATGTNAGLVLWEVRNPVSVVGASSNDDVRTRDCA
jgi:hypothetical protein